SSTSLMTELRSWQKLKCHQMRRSRRFCPYKGIVNCTSTYQDKKAVLQKRDYGSEALLGCLALR
uniref:Uncharacterized protein n=1 Tax=Calidris pygmaea TaxID=425635 RepID=A0A8C3PLP8_9CHAR